LEKEEEKGISVCLLGCVGVWTELMFLYVCRLVWFVWQNKLNM